MSMKNEEDINEKFLVKHLVKMTDKQPELLDCSISHLLGVVIKLLELGIDLDECFFFMRRSKREIKLIVNFNKVINIEELF